MSPTHAQLEQTIVILEVSVKNETVEYPLRYLRIPQSAQDIFDRGHAPTRVSLIREFKTPRAIMRWYNFRKSSVGSEVQASLL